jgi:hypothetical protein
MIKRRNTTPDPEAITAEVILTPKKQTESTLISLPRAEYERLLRTESLFAAVAQIIRRSDLSSFTLQQVLEAMFKKPAPEEETSTDTTDEVTPDA